MRHPHFFEMARAMTTRRASNDGQRGFTLIELLVVSGIIGLIGAIAIPALLRAKITANETAIIGSMTWTTPAPIQSAWDAPGVDPALLKALFLIFVELTLITAVALFFSTFSTPMLSAAFTFGLYVVGHFNADLRNFESVVESKSAATLARVLYHVLPDLSAFDVKTAVVHADWPGAASRPCHRSSERHELCANAAARAN